MPVDAALVGDYATRTIWALLVVVGALLLARAVRRATLKRFFREKDRVRLQPANGQMQPIYTRDIQIQGKVIGVIRRLA